MAPGRRGREHQGIFKQAVFKQSVFKKNGRRFAQGRRVKQASTAPAVADLKQASVASLAQAIPLHTDGMRIGLLGGSFNPPHDAHRAISLFAIKRLKLDRVWWLITPGNPLKEHGALHDLEQRAAAARKMAGDPRIDISCLESVIGTRYTVDTITYLRRRVPGLRLVWIMGADNLAQFHRWQNWRRIASEVPIAVIDRPPQSFRALAAPAAQALARYRLPENQAGRLAELRAPAWVFLTGMKLNLSSTGMRNPDGSWKTK
jgi:nicotinate-nucleotide adenylyltransferase